MFHCSLAMRLCARTHKTSIPPVNSDSVWSLSAAGLFRIHDGHNELLTQRTERGLELIESRSVMHVHQAIDLGKMPIQPAAEFGLSHVLLAHGFI